MIKQIRLTCRSGWLGAEHRVVQQSVVMGLTPEATPDDVQRRTTGMQVGAQEIQESNLVVGTVVWHDYEVRYPTLNP